MDGGSRVGMKANMLVVNTIFGTDNSMADVYGDHWDPISFKPGKDGTTLNSPVSGHSDVIMVLTSTESTRFNKGTKTIYT